MLREEADVDRFEVMEPGGSPKYLQSVGQAAVQIAPASTKVLTCIQAATKQCTCPGKAHIFSRAKTNVCVLLQS